ncbi:PAS domain-containing protein [Chachezhania sediminis]|uniref:PAS domain-containing protein n=1 Tax=Chachezhania sediminis TaxID=2599291 RepID=UPI00131BEB29|nr:PAS domain-containing protein [Chachezhania sediminis]
MSKRTTGSETLNFRAAASKVVPLFRSGGGPGLTPLRQAEAYWAALREDGGVPRRSQISPRGLSSLLPDTFILERVAQGEARFRIAGSRFTEYAGTELRGLPMTALFSAVARRQMAAVLEEVFSAPAVVELHLSCRPAATLRGKLAASFTGTVEARAILLPLKSDLGEVTRCMGVILFDKKPVAPLRLDVDTVSIRSVTGRPGDEDMVRKPQTVFEPAPAAEPPQRDQRPPLRPAAPAVPVAPKAAAEPAGMAEPTSGFATRQAPYLRLVSSRDTLERS